MSISAPPSSPSSADGEQQPQPQQQQTPPRGNSPSPADDDYPISAFALPQESMISELLPMVGISPVAKKKNSKSLCYLWFM